MTCKMDLKLFLVEAKRATYASTGEGGERTVLNGARELEYEVGSLRYLDRYYGFNPFLGEEVVWNHGKPIWGMNYFGGCQGSVIEPSKIYEFLKNALYHVSIESPFRGPSLFQSDVFLYSNQFQRDFASFHGREAIYLQEQLVYSLHYHGGMVL